MDYTSQNLIKQSREIIKIISADEFIKAVQNDNFDPPEILRPLLLEYIIQYEYAVETDYIRTNVKYVDSLATKLAITKYIDLISKDNYIQRDEYERLHIVYRSIYYLITTSLELHKCEKVIIDSIIRTFMNNPPNKNDLYQELSKELFETISAYIIPRVMLRDNNQLILELAIKAIVVLRSSLLSDVFKLLNSQSSKQHRDYIYNMIVNMYLCYEDIDKSTAEWIISVLNAD